MNKTILLFLLFNLGGSAMMGCAGKNLESGSQAENLPAPAPSAAPTHLDPVPPPAVLAAGWSEAIIIANSAKTRISTGAHFTTTRNACGKEAYGGLNLEDWNKLATSLNVAIQKEPVTADLRDEYCVSLPDHPPYMDGTVDVKTDERGTRTILQLQGDKICSTIHNIKASNELLTAVTNIIAAADKEDCPNGWGSN